MKAFVWNGSSTVRYTSCRWNGLHLMAHFDGIWSIREIDNDTILLDHHAQVKGSDFKDAQLRAQAAAMVLHKLRTKPDEHGRPDRTNSQ